MSSVEETLIAHKLRSKRGLPRYTVAAALLVVAATVPVLAIPKFIEYQWPIYVELIILAIVGETLRRFFIPVHPSETLRDKLLGKLCSTKALQLPVMRRLFDPKPSNRQLQEIEFWILDMQTNSSNSMDKYLRWHMQCLLALCYQMEGKPDDASETMTRCLEEARAQFDAERAEVAQGLSVYETMVMVLTVAAYLAELQGNVDAKREYLSQAVSISQSGWGDNSELLAITETNLAEAS